MPRETWLSGYQPTVFDQIVGCLWLECWLVASTSPPLVNSTTDRKVYQTLPSLQELGDVNQELALLIQLNKNNVFNWTHFDGVEVNTGKRQRDRETERQREREKERKREREKERHTNSLIATDVRYLPESFSLILVRQSSAFSLCSQEQVTQSPNPCIRTRSRVMLLWSTDISSCSLRPNKEPKDK